MKKTILWTIGLMVALCEVVAQNQPRYLYYGRAAVEHWCESTLNLNHGAPTFYHNGVSMSEVHREVYHSHRTSQYTVWQIVGASASTSFSASAADGLGSVVKSHTLNEARFPIYIGLYDFLGVGNTSQTPCLRISAAFAVYPMHTPTVKPLERTTFGRSETVVLEADYIEEGYLEADFVWEVSVDGINWDRRALPGIFIGKKVSIKINNLPSMYNLLLPPFYEIGNIVYFRLKYIPENISEKAPGQRVGSTPIAFRFVEDLPRFSSLLYEPAIRCPNEIPLPLFLPFNRELNSNEKITNVYLYQTVENGRPLDRVDLKFTTRTDGVEVEFGRVFLDGDYFLQKEGEIDGIRIPAPSTTIRIKNPQPLMFEKSISPSSGTEYHQGIPTILKDGAVTLSMKNYSDDCSIFWNDVEYKTSENTFSNLASGSYSAKISYNSNQCTISENIVVGNRNKSLDVRIVEGLPVSCNGMSNASLQANVERNTTTAPSFSWYKNNNLLQGETKSFLESLSVGNYRVICESEGLQSSFSFTITEPDELLLDVKSRVNPLCYGSNDGYIHIGASGGTSPYRYVWDNGVESDFINQLSANSYTVTVFDQRNCTLRHTTVLSNPPKLEVWERSIVHPTCSDRADGLASVQTRGGTGTRSYTWNGVSGFDLLSGVSEGVYHYVVRDIHSCQISGQVELIAPKPLLIAVVEEIEQTYFGSELGVIRPSESDGLIRVSATGGTIPYTYRWSNGATGNVLRDVAFGEYDVTVSDVNSCEETLMVKLPQRFPLVSVLQTGSHIRCFESDDAVLQASVEGGIPPYHYRWIHNNDDALQQSGLGIGTYEFEAIDSRGVRSFDRIYVSQPEPLQVVLSADSVSGWGASDGSVYAVASGGTPPYTFEWGCSTAASVAGLRAGTYHLRLTDANSCWLEDSVVIETPDSLTLEGQVYHCTYFGSIQGISPIEPDDGRIECRVEGGVKPYTYQWFYQMPNSEWVKLLSENSTYIDLLTGGRYVLLVTDSKGYSVSDTFEVIKRKPLMASISPTSPLCFGNSDGTLEALVTGGTPPYTYQWNLGDTTALLQGLAIGHYSIIVHDWLGVSSTFEHTLTQPQPLTIDYSINEITKDGLNDGAIFVAANGGISPYSYLWSSRDTIGNSPQIVNIYAGIYTFQLTDFNGCLLSTSFAINNPDAMEITALIKPMSYLGSVQGRIAPQPADGEIYLTVSGGFPPYEYLWATGEKTSYLTGLSGGSYTVTVVDKYGNEAYGSFDVKSTQPLMLTVSQDNLIACFGDYSARLTSHISGGTPPYEFLWNTGTTGIVANSLPSGDYHLTVTDSLSVAANFTIRVNEPTSLFVDENVIQPQCPNPVNGAIRLFISGGTPSYQYLWNTGEQTAQLYGLSDGIYEVSVSDANGCRENRSFTLQTPLVAHIQQHDFIRCFGDSNVTLELIVCGGVEPYKILWNTGDTTLFLHEQKGGVYNVKVTDKVGNVYTASIDVFEPSILSVDGTFTHPSCFGESDGRIDIFAEGGTYPYLYRWSNMATTSQLTHLSRGFYSMFVTDRNGCQVTYSTTLVEPKKLQIDLGFDRTLCRGQVYSIVLPYDNLVYLWQKNGSLFHTGYSVDLSETGVYTVIAEDEIGCKAFDTLHIETVQDYLTAEFWHSHEALVGEDFVVANIGQTPFDHLTWNVTPNAQILSQNYEYLILRFPDTGSYEIRLTTYKNNCFEEQTGFVNVIAQQEKLRMKSTVTSLLSDLIIFPNPAKDRFSFSVQSKKPTVLYWTLTHVSTGSVALFGKVETDQNGLAAQQILLQKQLHGVYVFRIFSGNDHISSQIIIH